MTTTITFSRQNKIGSRVSNTRYRENLVLVVVLVSESKALNCLQTDNKKCSENVIRLNYEKP